MIEFDVGDVIDDRYEVIGETVRGGMGIVLRVKDQDTGSEVALKYCPTTDETAIRRFSREVRIMADIRHPHVMPVLAQNGTYDPPYFIMPIASGSIREEVDEDMDIEVALDIFQSICLGVQAIHSAGSTHRDLKPDNAMRMEDGRIVISDLGLARLADRDTTTLTQTAVFLGTITYCAPEQLIPGGSREADQRTDVYQLGKILYELITANPPALIDPELVEPGLRHVVDRATQQHPDRRYQSVGQLMDAVESFLRSQDPNASILNEFQAELEKAKSLLEEDKYNTKNIERLLELLINLQGDDEAYMEQFEIIPDRLLRIMTERKPVELERPLERYCEVVENIIGGCNFSHAEIVARKMNVIFRSADSTSLKVVALRATMIAAVELNRFAAMEVYDRMIQSIEEADVAGAVAEMLRKNRHYYRRLEGRVPENRLHPMIRQVSLDSSDNS